MIRPYENKDFGRYKEIIRDCFKESVRIDSDLEERMKEAIIECFTSDYWKEKLMTVYDSFVCERNDLVLGSGALLGNEVDMLFIDPKYHGQGAGTEMINFLEQLGKHKGFDELILHSYLNGIPFYKNKKYKIVGTFYYPYPEEGFNIPTTEMIKKIL